MNDITIYPIFPFLCSHFPPKTIKKMEGKNHNSICALLKKNLQFPVTPQVTVPFILFFIWISVRVLLQKKVKLRILPQ